jgi:peptidoglycan/xylan/chitin deacetylase (PgdA/CDA1 family)
MKLRLHTVLCAALALTAACSDEVTDDAESGSVDDVAAADPAAWGEAHALLEGEKEDLGGCNGVRLPDQGDFGGRVALTFDDGPDPVHTTSIMETLRAHQAPATFFVLGKATRVSGAAAVLEDLVADPSFIVGNHTWTHPNMALQDEETVIDEIERTTEALRAAGAEPEFFRFPYGSSNCRTAEAVRSRGMHITGWHVDSADWCYNASDGYCSPATFEHVPDRYRDDMMAYIMMQVRRNNGGVLLFHDIKRYTSANLDAILMRLAEEGYSIVPLDDVDTFPRLNGIEPPPVPFVGDACEDDGDCEFSFGDREGFCISGFCSLDCEGFCPDQHGKAATFCVQDPSPNAAAGICVSRSSGLNGNCAEIDGAIEADVERFTGNSGAPESRADACIADPAQAQL